MEIDGPRRDILAARGHILVQGGPGCGKTTIALLKASAIARNLKPEQRVLFLSFSRAAVRQVTDRMRGLLDTGTRARLEIRTFHAFFHDLVHSHGRLLVGRPVSVVTPDRERQLQAGHQGNWADERARLFREEGRLTFDGLAPAVAALLEGHPAVRLLYSDRYPFIVVDEFQDTNVDQWRVVRALSATSTIACLADPDQRIFGHLPGVDDQRLAQAIKHLQPEVFDLSADNHRSPGGGLLDYANAVLRNEPHVAPGSVATRSYRFTLEPAVHAALLQLDDYLAQQLGHAPSLAVLAPVNSIVGSISDQLSAAGTWNGSTLPAVDHQLHWDPEFVAAAGLVVASILEWPGLPDDRALLATLLAIRNYYRAKGIDTKSGRETANKIDRAIAALAANKPSQLKAVTALHAGQAVPLGYTGQIVADWQRARARLTGASELAELHRQVRSLRLSRATDAPAWALTGSWDGTSYRSAAQIVRQVLNQEALESAGQEPARISLMSMHRSKGKEFDGVLIAEGSYSGRLLDVSWDADRTAANRRLLRVALTRARHQVVLVRPRHALPLTSPSPPLARLL